MSIRSFLASPFKRRATIERAEDAYAQDRKADAAALFRELAEGGSAHAQLRLAQMYEAGEGVLQSFVEAVRWYRSAGEQGSVAALSRLGEIYLTGMAAPDTATKAALEQLGESAGQESLLKRLYPQGLAISQDLEQAAHWSSRAAHAGDAGAQARLGYQYASGLGLARDLSQAEFWFDAAAKQEHPAGQLGLGMLYAGSYGERREHERSLQWLEPCAAAGNSTAQLCLAMLLLFGDVPRDEARAAALLEEAPKSGQPAAMFHLGELYRRGVGVAQSASDAETWLRRAATRGYLKAWLALVQLFRSGPDPDLNTAAVLCRQAADLGDGEAQYLLGQFYLTGAGVPRDASEAARWLAKAADQNVMAAYDRLGAMYAEGLGLPQDFQAAADWFHRAAALGSINALYHLGTLQLGGLGVPRDQRAARRWYRQAATQGNAQQACSSESCTPPASTSARTMRLPRAGIRSRPARARRPDSTTWRSCICADWAWRRTPRALCSSSRKPPTAAASRPRGRSTSQYSAGEYLAQGSR